MHAVGKSIRCIEKWMTHFRMGTTTSVNMQSLGRIVQRAPCVGAKMCFFFVTRLDALALSVIATATWLAGWLGGWLSHSGIVSKPLYVSENFFDHLKAPSFYFSVTPASIQNSRRNPFVECVKYRGGGNGDCCLIFDIHRRLSRKRCKIGQ